MGIRQALAPAMRRVYHRQAGRQVPEAAAERDIDWTRPAGVGVFGYLGAESGVGEAARGTVAALQAAGVPVAPLNVEVPVYANREAAPELVTRRDNPFAINLLQLNADQMARLPQLIDMANHAGRYTIGYWAWELPELPPELVPAFAAVHEVWVPSRFVAAAIEGKTDKPVRVMPHRITVTPQSSVSRADFGLPEDAVVFLATVDFNSVMARKNPLGAIAAFRKAFEGDAAAKAHLVIKAHGGAGTFRRARAQLQAALDGDPRISLIDRVLSRAEVTALQASADVFVSLHRAEGFGLPIAESMALGKLVIATDYSGSTDFVSAENALPVPYRLVELSDRDYPLGRGQVWAEPDIEVAARLMRLAASDAELRARLGAVAARQISQQFSPQRVGALMRERLAEIRARP